MITKENKLTWLEANVLNDLAHGLTTTQIAAKRGLIAALGERCVNELYAKLGATSHQNLIAKAYIRGFIDESAFDATFVAAVAPVAQRKYRNTSCFP